MSFAARYQSPPAPESGVMTELARFEAERALTHAVRDAIKAGRL